MATNSFLKVTTVTSATLALLAGTATAAYAEEPTTSATAEPTAATSTDAPVAPEATAEATAEATPAETPEATAEEAVAETPATSSAETTPAAEATSTEQEGINAWFQPGDHVKTQDGLFVLVSLGITMGPDGQINGAGGFANYDANKIFLELTERNDGSIALKANVYEALGIPQNDESQFLSGIGTWGTSNHDVLTVDPSGTLTAGADGDVTIGFMPAFIENNTVVYKDLTYTINLTVKDGVISVAETAPEDDSIIGHPINLPDGVLFSLSSDRSLDGNGNTTGLATVPVAALQGTRVAVENADSLTVGNILTPYFDYTHAADLPAIEAVLKDYPEASIMGTWSSSDSAVLEVREDDNGVSLVAVGAGTVTLTYTPDYVEGNKLATSPLTYTVELTIASSSTPVEPEPTPVDPTPAPTPGPVDPTPAPVDPTPAPTPTPEQPAPPVADPTDPAAPFVYENCAAVYEAGAAPIREGDYGWHKSLDADGDGVGCEVKPDYTNEKDANKDAAQKQKNNSSSTTGKQNNKQLANTGAEALAPLMGGMALIAAGASAVAVSRRRTK